MPWPFLPTSWPHYCGNCMVKLNLNASILVHVDPLPKVMPTIYRVRSVYSTQIHVNIYTYTIRSGFKQSIGLPYNHTCKHVLACLLVCVCLSVCLSVSVSVYYVIIIIIH